MKDVRFFNQPRVLRAVHGGLVVFWCIIWALAWMFGWLDSVRFVSHLSIIALVLSSGAAWQASRTEVKEDEKNDV